MARTAQFCWRSHEHGLASEPGSAQLPFWLGKSYERMAQGSEPIARTQGRPKNTIPFGSGGAARSRQSGVAERAIRVYVDSPE